MTTLKRHAVRLPDGNPLLHCSAGIRVGPYLFTSGQLATDWSRPRSSDTLLPHSGDSTRLEVRAAFRNLQTVIEAGGMTLDDIARVDNYYGNRRVSTGHFAARDEFFPMDPMQKPASTAVQTAGFPAAGYSYAIEAIAIEGGRQSLTTDEVPASPGRLPMGIRAGDFVFLSGRLASNYHDGLATDARSPNWIWIGSPIQLQTRYILKEHAQILSRGGLSLADVVKAEVFICNPVDITGLDEVWREAFPVDPPARSVFVVDGLALPDGVVEINLIALDPNSGLTRQTVETSAAPEPLFYEPQAVRAGPLVFLSTQFAHDQHGLAAAARPAPGFPHLGSAGRLQAEYILANVAAICEAAGGGLENVAKVQTYLQDLGELDAVNEVWKRAFPADPPAWNVVEMSAPHPVSGAVMTCDFIACVQDGA